MRNLLQSVVEPKETRRSLIFYYNFLPAVSSFPPLDIIVSPLGKV